MIWSNQLEIIHFYIDNYVLIILILICSFTLTEKLQDKMNMIMNRPT